MVFYTGYDHLILNSSEHLLVLRGASFPDVMNLLTIGSVDRIGSEYILDQIFSLY